MVKQLLIFLAVTLLITACGTAPQPQAVESASSQAQIARTPVEVSVAESGDISLIFDYTGNLKATADIDVKPKLSGEITSILVDVGDKVEAGDPIALIDDEPFQLDLKSAELALRKAQLDLAKMEQGARDEEIAAARAAVRLAEAALQDVTHVDNDERTVAVLNLAQAQAELRRAQAEYDRIAWAGQVGTTPQAAQLEQATAAYEAALSSYNLSTNPSDATLAPLEAQLVEAQLNLDLAEEPFRPLDFETARTLVAQAEVAMQKANLQLEYTTITVPFDGVIASLEIEKGSLVSPQSAIVRLVSQQVEVEVSVEESRLGQIEAGQPAGLKVSAYPGVDFPAVVNNVPPVADGATHTFEVLVTPQDDRNLLRSGMFADVSIMAEVKENTLLVPRAAVTLMDGQSVVYVVTVKDDSQVAEQRKVTTGLLNKDQIEIVSGVEAGESVVIQGQANLVDGADVTIIE